MSVALNSAHLTAVEALPVNIGWAALLAVLPLNIGVEPPPAAGPVAAGPPEPVPSPVLLTYASR